jgi:zinc/manganese transport system substrate-binding protein
MRTILVISIALTLGAAGCGGSSGSGGSALDVVASTNVYGDIAAQIGGSNVHLTSVLTNPDADPHLFEPGTKNGLAVAEARLVIQNGAGYDDFMGRLESASPSSSRIVVTIADVLGVRGRDANPHLWYDVPRLPQIAGAIAAGLEQADPKHSDAYRAGLGRFTKSLRPLDDVVRRIRTRYAGRPVAYTEPVPGYLLAAAGLRNLAPASFTRAIENGSEPPPEAVAAMDALIRGRQVDALLYNNQAVSPITTQIRAAAQQAGIPVVGVAETIPPHLSFQQWQLAQVRSLERALAR